jgi:hypothetical protein
VFWRIYPRLKYDTPDGMAVSVVDEIKERMR